MDHSKEIAIGAANKPTKQTSAKNTQSISKRKDGVDKHREQLAPRHRTMTTNKQAIAKMKGPMYPSG